VLAFLADENFHRAIVRGLRLQRPEIDVVRVQEVGLIGADDPAVLDWAARERRLLLTHDQATVPDFAGNRVAAGLPMPGVVRVPDTMSLAEAIEAILVIAECSQDGEWEGHVLYLPF
jgi:predicted nuclease of predicted toxin-antitoxin system